uniref:Uncharacterized protein n=1 Tax=Podoviridae sp. ctoqT5 TaxID=2826577 RepID=A0A8S5MQ96_9CAUD|nr:MAG TPA: hypothetical protein [Podoviridae sp. ctoqT5]
MKQSDTLPFKKYRRYKMKDIANNDFESDMPIGEIEAIRHATI